MNTTFQTEIVNCSEAGKGHIRGPFSFLICLFAEDYSEEEATMLKRGKYQARFLRQLAEETLKRSLKAPDQDLPPLVHNCKSTDHVKDGWRFPPPRKVS
jgi:hypothetical protein